MATRDLLAVFFPYNVGFLAKLRACLEIGIILLVLLLLIIIIQHLFMRHISSHCGHSEAHYKHFTHN